MHKLKKVLANQGVAYGMFLGLKDPAIVEIAGCADYDFVVIDMEHSTLDLSTLEHMIRAAQLADVTSVIRIPLEDSASLLRALECGADALMIPHIRTKEDVEKAVGMAKYRPIGKRGIDDSTRAAKYGTVSLIKHIQEQNEHVFVIAMIEDAEAMDHLDEIVKVPGLDQLFIGMADLASSLGVLGQPENSILMETVRTIIEKGTRAGLTVGMSASDEKQVMKAVNLGARFVTTPDVDILHLTQTLQNHLKTVKEYLLTLDRTGR